MLDNASFCLTRLRPTPSAAFIPVQSIAVDQIRVDPDARLLKLTSARAVTRSECLRLWRGNGESCRHQDPGRIMAGHSLFTSFLYCSRRAVQLSSRVACSEQLSRLEGEIVLCTEITG